jgi:serine/threonine protein kinase
VRDSVPGSRDSSNEKRAKIERKHRYHWSLDTYSFGILLWELFTSLYPFSDLPADTKKQVLSRMRVGERGPQRVRRQRVRRRNRKDENQCDANILNHEQDW